MDRRELLLMGIGVCAAAAMPKVPLISFDPPIYEDALLLSSTGGFKDGDIATIYDRHAENCMRKVRITAVDRVNRTVWFENA
jgi:hypothetical protein